MTNWLHRLNLPPPDEVTDDLPDCIDPSEYRSLFDFEDDD